jgi:hypothetical protein
MTTARYLLAFACALLLPSLAGAGLPGETGADDHPFPGGRPT